MVGGNDRVQLIFYGGKQKYIYIHDNGLSQSYGNMPGSTYYSITYSCKYAYYGHQKMSAIRKLDYNTKSMYGVKTERDAFHFSSKRLLSGKIKKTPL